jgi:prophage regulatory protein
MAEDELASSANLLREWQILKLIPVSKSTLRRWIASGEFPAGVKISERIWVWRESVVRDWIDGCTRAVGNGGATK